LGSVYALIALGFVLIYKSTAVINFSQGEMVMLGAYFALLYTTYFGLSVPVAFALTLVSGFALGLLMELALRPLIRAPLWSIIMATFGASFFLKSIVRLQWGSSVYPFPSYFSTTPHEVVGVVITPQRVGITVITVIVMVLLFVFFQFTKVGTAMRATSENRRAAQLMGVRVSRVFSLSWALSGVLGGLSGLLLAPIIPVNPDMGLIALKGFTACVIGGFVSFPGVIIGGFVIGLAESFASGFIAAGLEEVVALSLLIVVLLIKPTGLFAELTVRRV
jgi:branched-chain amino acid transport system permease protein